MKLYNLRDNNQQVSFAEALQQGLGTKQGLFFPLELAQFNAADIDYLLTQDMAARSSHILSTLIGDELLPQALSQRVSAAFNFPIQVKKIAADIAAVELFHGPTLAFKDFGARFMAQMLAAFSDGQTITILTATSGDTGAAVAHAFYGQNNIRVIILYPKDKISLLQEALFCTLGGNIHTLAIEGDFDTCQSLVKQAFADTGLRHLLRLNSANSINISRLLAQICYYFEAVAQLPPEKRNQLVISVPSGNFGNLTAGLWAKALGLPIKRFIAATNANDTVPRFLMNGQWQPQPAIATLSSAMDVSQPNNWPRVEELLRRKAWPLHTLGFASVSDNTTREALHALSDMDYLSEPHGAIAWRVLRDQLQEGEFGLFLATAHPAKFKSSVDPILNQDIPLPAALAQCASLPLLSEILPADFARLRTFLLKIAQNNGA